MPHFFINSNSIENNNISIMDEELLNHLVKSLRLKEGERLLLFDENKIRYETKIKSVSKREIITEIENKYPSQRFIDYEIYLAPSIIKQDGFNELISGVTQLGIKGLYPLYTDNTAVSKSQIENKTQKWQKISDESVKQCERADFMKVFETSNLQNFDYSMFDKIIVFSEIEEKKSIKRETFEEHLIQTMACKMSIKAHDPLSLTAMEELLDELFKCDNPYNCAHGRPSIIKFSNYELDRMFKRAMN